MYIYGRVHQVAGGLREKEKNCLFEKEKIVSLLFIDDSCSRASARRSEGHTQFMGLQLIVNFVCVCVCMCVWERERERERCL